MGVIVLEGIVVTILVLVGLREAIMNAVPLALKRAIGVGIGLFILFIGFANGGLIVSNCAPDSATLGFCNGTLVTIVVPDDRRPVRLPARPGRSRSRSVALKVRAALIISIAITTIVALRRRRRQGPERTFVDRARTSRRSAQFDLHQRLHQARRRSRRS